MLQSENFSIHKIFRMTSVQIKIRKLKFHEQKLLKKVDFLQWESDGDPKYRQRILRAIKEFQLRDQQEFFKYQIAFLIPYIFQHPFGILKQQRSFNFFHIEG